MKQFDTNENQFWRQWQSRYLEGYEKIKKIEIDMKEEHKMNPESSREIASLIFTQSFKPVADLIEDRLAQHAREAEKSPLELTPVPKINIKSVASPF